ncbi:MAG: MqnA/MqnD/SBP family protein [Thermoplasmata archaeon]
MKNGFEIKSFHYYDPVHAYFLVFGFLSGELKSRIKINPSYEEFDTLNKRLIEKKDIDLSAISSVNYWKVADEYYLLRSGSTQRMDVGAIIVSKRQYRKDEINDLKIAIPGRSFSGYFYYRLFFKAKEEVVFRFDMIIDAVLNGDADIGLLIPGPTLTSAYEKFKLIKIADVLEEWKKKAGNIPMPMGSYVLKKKYSIEEAIEIRKTFQESINYAKLYSANAFSYAMNFAKGAEPEALKYFLDGCTSIYDMGENGIKAIRKVHEIAKENDLIDRIPEINTI